MVHQPFEEWLLNDEILTSQQEKDLQTHLRSCPACSALFRANLSLRAVPVSKPAPGFACCFEARLAAERVNQRRRVAIGLVMLIGAGGFLIWRILLPVFPFLRLEPLQLVWPWFGSLTYFALALRTVSALGTALFNVFTQAIPVYLWWAGLAIFSFAAYAWQFSLHKVTKHLLYAKGEANR